MATFADATANWQLNLASLLRERGQPLDLAILQHEYTQRFGSPIPVAAGAKLRVALLPAVASGTIELFHRPHPTLQNGPPTCLLVQLARPIASPPSAQAQLRPQPQAPRAFSVRVDNIPGDFFRVFLGGQQRNLKLFEMTYGVRVEVLSPLGAAQAGVRLSSEEELALLPAEAELRRAMAAPLRQYCEKMRGARWRKLHIYVDFSNVMLGARHGEPDRERASRSRLHFGALLNRVAQHGNVRGLVVCGSAASAGVARAMEAAWREAAAGPNFSLGPGGPSVHFQVRAPGQGEMNVDDRLIAAALQRVCLSTGEDEGDRPTMVLLTGDGNNNMATGHGAAVGGGGAFSCFVNAAQVAASQGWQEEIWSWLATTSERYQALRLRYPQHVELWNLDTYREELVYYKQPRVAATPAAALAAAHAAQADVNPQEAHRRRLLAMLPLNTADPPQRRDPHPRNRPQPPPGAAHAETVLGHTPAWQQNLVDLLRERGQSIELGQLQQHYRQRFGVPIPVPPGARLKHVLAAVAATGAVTTFHGPHRTRPNGPPSKMFIQLGPVQPNPGHMPAADGVAPPPGAAAAVAAQVPPAVVPAVRQQVCAVCRHDIQPDSGLTCGEGHSLCKDCLDVWVNHACVTPEIDAVADNLGLRCPMRADGCVAAPWTISALTRVLDEDQVIRLAQAHAQRAAEAAVAEHQVATNTRVAALQAQVRQMAGEAAGVIDAAAIAVDAHRVQVEGLLTLRCTNCQQAWLDFTNCCALQCHHCQDHFCAFCLQSCGTQADAHAHVRLCPLNESHNLFLANRSDLDRVHRKGRVRVLRGYLQREVPAALRQRVVLASSKSLDDVGITAAALLDLDGHAAAPGQCTLM